MKIKQKRNKILKQTKAIKKTQTIKIEKNKKNV